ncbi:hypothetical protein [Streptomyces netropsis]|uniref:Uncharacterized protein n=1 Tax=Streptomyces netropsis TaxID=55404 RepID=A0A7W7LDH7_STRNE|nr:hypothetical protein [Streptomyces netropsis]MBB4887611.1 hypothetical protein [Streptomyces netropsis]GGR34562.1 hypothetical protein GCM10010219_44440 [Streptomyces netropsis]
MTTGTNNPTLTGTGAWRCRPSDFGEHLELTADQNAALSARWEQARSDLGLLDDVMADVLRQTAEFGGTSREPEHRLKALQAFRVRSAGQLASRVPLGKITERVVDLNRYTLTFREEHLTEGVERAYALLREKGFELVPGSERDTWADPLHKALHTAWQWGDEGSPRKFEIQFHTPGSYWARSKNHDDYVRYRSSRYRRIGADGRDLPSRQEERAVVLQSERYHGIPVRDLESEVPPERKPEPPGADEAVRFWALYTNDHAWSRGRLPRTVFRRRRTPEHQDDTEFSPHGFWSVSRAMSRSRDARDDDPPHLVEISAEDAERLLQELRGLTGATGW